MFVLSSRLHALLHGSKPTICHPRVGRDPEKSKIKVKSPVISEDMAVMKKDLMVYLASKDKWLLVFDNLKIGENKKIEDFINWEYNGNIIFCSQYNELLSNIIKANAFTKPEAVLLAKKYIGK
ncbi:hypothetical protein [Rickettsia japonica]|uniref:hypothetical protein n=1 Tax=Rickettsia japonica TaxID=35790 RepID=UPI001E496760|nr:hypothetical protein [Rickettsia japonica]